MQEKITDNRINQYHEYKQKAGQSLSFMVKNPACSIPCLTGFCSIIFVFGLLLMTLILYFLTQY
jgi:hypothetical protein